MFRSLKIIASKQSLFIKNFFNFSVVKFNLPDLGQKIKQGTIKKLYIKQGDRVEEFQKLADVASDKQFTQITAGDSGIIKKIHFFQEDICQVGQLFLQIQVEDESQQKVESKTEKQQKASKKKSKQTKDVNTNKRPQGNNLATPYVRGLIKMNNLNIDQIQGSGPEGRITEQDIKSILQGKRQPKRTPSIQFGKKSKARQQANKQTAHKQQTKKASHEQSPKHHKQIFTTQDTFQVKKMSLFEKGMQKSMTIANTIPHLYYHQEIDLTECQKLRKTLKQNSKKVTVMGLLLKTFSMALKKYPKMNSTYHPQINQFQYKVHQNHNISIAIDSPNGLVVPNIKNVQNISLLKIQQQIQRLKKLAVDAHLTSHELNNGTICISNIGTIGGIMANPLILAPQTCIVAIGKLQTVAKYRDSMFVPKNIINVSFGCDHRIIDGATVARFTNEWKSLLQNPYIAMAEMV